jgi:hypothetical protein
LTKEILKATLGILRTAGFSYSEENGPYVALNSLEEIPMAETAKKAKAPAKPRKTATKSKSEPAETKSVSHDEIAQLAHRLWAERGHQHGEPELDWFRAEQKLRGKAS